MLFRSQADTKDIIAEMAAGFERFFVNGAALTVAPIISVGIFEEFRELTPSGARGDAIMNRLVDHMLTMDLLDRAADLLDHLVKHRFTGADKAAAGAKLALVRLLDGDSTRALTAIDDSSESGLSTELQSQRLRLAARALSGLGRPEDALQRISGDDSGNDETGDPQRDAQHGSPPCGSARRLFSVVLLRSPIHSSTRPARQRHRVAAVP